MIQELAMTLKIDNNIEVVEDVQNANKDVQDFLKEMSNEILSHPSRNEIIECHINPFTVEERRKIIVDKLNELLK
ncbi:MAG: hypothetical protein ACQETL_14440 [Bacteroidota bacterium]